MLALSSPTATLHVVGLVCFDTTQRFLGVTNGSGRRLRGDGDEGTWVNEGEGLEMYRLELEG